MIAGFQASINAMTTRKLLFALSLLLIGTIVRGEIFFQNDGVRNGRPNYPQTPQAHGTVSDVTNPVFQGTSAIKFTQHSTRRTTGVTTPR